MVGGGTGSWGPAPRSSPPIPNPLQSDHWYSEVFRALPDLVCQLLPGLAAAGPGDTDTETAYAFRPITLKKVTHHPDGVLWPPKHPGCSEKRPVVILEVQMHADRRFHRRLAAETFRLLQQHEEVEHLRVLVLLSASPATLSPRYPRPSALAGNQALLIGGHHHQLKGR